MLVKVGVKVFAVDIDSFGCVYLKRSKLYVVAINVSSPLSVIKYLIGFYSDDFAEVYFKIALAVTNIAV